MEDILSIIESWIELTPGAFSTENEGDWIIAHDFFHAWLGLGITKREEEKVTAFTLALQGYKSKEICLLIDRFNYICTDEQLLVFAEIAYALPEEHICRKLAKEYPIEV